MVSTVRLALYGKLAHGPPFYYPPKAIAKRKEERKKERKKKEYSEELKESKYTGQK